MKVLAVDSLSMYVLDRSNNYLRYSENDWTVISPKQWKKVKTLPGVTLAKDVPENLLREDHIGGEVLESSNGYLWTGISL